MFLEDMLPEMKEYDSGLEAWPWRQHLGGPECEPTVQVVRCGWDKFKRWS